MGMSVEIIHEKKNKLDTLRRNRIEKGCTICGESGHNRKTCKKRQEAASTPSTSDAYEVCNYLNISF